MEIKMNLSGNLAPCAVLSLREPADVAGQMDGDAICFEDLSEFSGAVKSGGLKEHAVIVLRVSSCGYSMQELGRELKLLTIYYPDKSSLILSDVPLPETRQVIPVYVDTGDSPWDVPFALIRNGDHIRLEPGRGALYWYVADEELIYRKAEQRRASRIGNS